MSVWVALLSFSVSMTGGDCSGIGVCGCCLWVGCVGVGLNVYEPDR